MTVFLVEASLFALIIIKSKSEKLKITFSRSEDHYKGVLEVMVEALVE